MVVDEDHGYLLGVTFVGPGVEELINSATIAVVGQVPVRGLWLPCPVSLPSAKYGCACSRPIGTEPGSAVTLSSAAGGCLIPNGSWCLPPSSVMPRRVRRRCPDDIASLTM